MKFICVMKQNGEGCDYTIGCGMRFFTLNAETPEEATDKIIKKLDFEDYESGNSNPGYHCKDGEQELSIWRLFEIKAEYNLLELLHQWEVNFNEAENTRKTAKKEAEERAEYEKLKQKFG